MGSRSHGFFHLGGKFGLEEIRNKAVVSLEGSVRLLIMYYYIHNS